jgi:hypothetical protein
VSDLFRPAFPSADLVRAAASMLTPLPRWQGNEGPRSRLLIGPGVVAVGRHDPARAERTHERALRARDAAIGLGVADLLLPDRLVDAETELDALNVLASAGLAPWAMVDKAGGWVDHLASRLAGLDGDEGPAGPARIVAWSRKSRARMVRTLAELDYAPLFVDPESVPAMLTLTYPGDWLPVAASPKVCKGHLDALGKRFAREYGRALVGVWKREFQRRGAPHYHLLMVPPRERVPVMGPRPLVVSDVAASRPLVWAGVPMRRPLVGPKGARVRFIGPMPQARARLVGPMPLALVPMVGPLLPVRWEGFAEWVSRTWAEVVDHPDAEERRRHRLAGTGVDYAEGMRAADPKRLAVYFSKHGAYAAKEYQNEAPAEWVESGSVGRFWGYWGLDKGTAVVEVSTVEAHAAARTLRRWQRANGYRVQREVWRTNTRTGVQRRRKSGTWAGARMRGSLGFVVVNDGAAFGSTLARYLDAVREAAQADELRAWVNDPERLRRVAGEARREPAPAEWRGVPFARDEDRRQYLGDWMRARGLDPLAPMFDRHERDHWWDCLPA